MLPFIALLDAFLTRVAQGHQLASSVAPSYFSLLHSQGTTLQLSSLYGERLTCHSSQGEGCGEQHLDGESNKDSGPRMAKVAQNHSPGASTPSPGMICEN